MKAKLKASVVPDGIELIAGKWYDVLDVECHGEKGRFGEVKKVLIQSEKKRDPEWYKAEYFILAAEAQAYADHKRRKWVFQFDRQAYCNQRGRE